MKSKYLVSVIALTSFVFGETIKMKDEPIKSRISFKQLNRISVKNDRIDSVSGLDVAFHFEKNEKTGDGYIKPTEENGHEPIAVSVTTASGRVQELILDVDDGNPNVLILENDEAEGDFIGQDTEPLGDVTETSTGSSDYETSIVEGMKKLIAGNTVLPIKLSAKPTKKVSGFNVKFLESYKVGGGFMGYKFQVLNDSDVMTDLKESDFWSEDDLALSFSNLSICKGKSSFLYVLARA